MRVEEPLRVLEGSPQKGVKRSSQGCVWRSITREKQEKQQKAISAGVRSHRVSDAKEFRQKGGVEVWRPWPYEGWEDCYAISSWGRVRRSKPGPGTHPGRIVKQRLKKETMTVVNLRNGEKKDFVVRTAVRRAFTIAGEGAQTVHLDGNPWNCAVWNLEARRHATRQKLDEKQRREIHALHMHGGVTQKVLAERYQVDRSVISRTVQQVEWEMEFP